MKLTTLKQIKKWLESAKGYILNKIVELTTTTIAAIEEIENKKADKARYISVTILSGCIIMSALSFSVMPSKVIS